MTRNPKDLERHTPSERVNHWIDVLLQNHRLLQDACGMSADVRCSDSIFVGSA